MEISYGVDNFKMVKKGPFMTGGPGNSTLGFELKPQVTIPRREIEHIARSKGYSASQRKYYHGLNPNQPKLNNLYIGQREGWHLQDAQGKDLGDLAIAIVSDMKKKGKIGPMTAMEHLKQGEYVQKHSYLQPHQIFPAKHAEEPLSDPKEKYYSQVIAELNGKGVGFAIVDRAKFADGADGESYVKMFYVPALLKTDKEDFSKAQVVKGNGHSESLTQLIARLALDHVGGRNMLTVFDAPETELEQLRPYNFKALAPLFDVPEVKARTSKQFSKKADQIYLVIRPPEGPKSSNYGIGVELDKAFDLLNGYWREAYIDEYATVRGNKQFRLKRIDSARKFYDNGIKSLVDNAVKVGDKIIVQYKDNVDSTFTQLTPVEKEQLQEKYKSLGAIAFQKYIRHVPEK